MNPTITIDPDPPTQGQNATVTYSGSNPQSLTIETVPPGLITSPQMTDVDGHLVLSMPDSIEAITISGGGASALSSVVLVP